MIGMAFAIFFGIQQALAGVAPSTGVALDVSDNFNRGDGALGANWTAMAAPEGAPHIVSQALDVTDDVGARWSADTFADNQYSELETSGINDGHNSAGVAVRIQAGAASFYYGIRYDQSSPAGAIYKVTAGTPTLLAAHAASGSGIIRLEVSGTTLTLYELASHGGAKTQIVQTTDSDFATGSAGIFMTSTDATLGGNADNWYGGNL